MKMNLSTFRIVAALACLLPLSALAAEKKTAADNPDFTSGGAIPANAKHDWNLGPTGARGWIYTREFETTEARQIYVTQVDAGSPGASVLRLGDVILGVGGAKFSHDPRTEFGKAISTAEGGDGALKLSVWREGKVSDVVVKLPVLGSYGATAPFDCQKSKRIFEQGCEALAQSMNAKPKAGNEITRSLNALALLASGRAEYLPLVRAEVERAAKYSDPAGKSYHSWFYGPVTILVAEYTLTTGDRAFFPDLTRLASEISRGQSSVGSWGHRFAEPGGQLRGYGMMNAPGVPLTTSLILAREAGVKSPELDAAIAKSLLLLRFYVGKGSVPYGDHPAWTQTHDDNGKNGIAAMMFHLAGESEAARYFSRMSVASHGAERDCGHTGNFFNMLWAVPGVALSGPQAAGAWMKEFGWYYDLARRWDGSFRHQGAPEAQPDSYEGWDSTGAYLLAYAQPLRKIHLAGKKPGIAGNVDAATAASLIEDGRGWSQRTHRTTYATRTDEQLLKSLGSWSPVVRGRAALEIPNRKDDFVPRLIALLESRDLNSRIGACQALGALAKRAAPAVPALRKTLQAEDLWLRIVAAETLGKIGDDAKPAVPDLLTMLPKGPDAADPRAMQQRYLSFALFDRREGLLKKSIDGVDREALARAVRAGLHNQDGHARSQIGNIYSRLSAEEIEPLLPAIHEAIVRPAPSNQMFADGVRLSGLEVFAKHRIREGMALCLDLIELDRWGLGNRLPKCLATLQTYGGAAKPLLPRLRELETALLAKKKPQGPQPEIELVRKTISLIESDANPPALRPLPTAR